MHVMRAALRARSVTVLVTSPAVSSNASWATWACAESDAPKHHARRSARAVPGRPCEKAFNVFRANELWLAGIPPQAGGIPSYVRTFSGWVYVAFVTDVFSRRIIGWQTSTSLYADLALDVLEMAVWQRKRQAADLSGPGHHLRPWRAVPSHPIWAGSIRL